jgi:hypothetical protein
MQKSGLAKLRWKKNVPTKLLCKFAIIKANTLRVLVCESVKWNDWYIMLTLTVKIKIKNVIDYGFKYVELNRW